MDLPDSESLSGLGLQDLICVICRIPAHNNTSYLVSGSQSPDGLSMSRSFARGKGEFVTRAGGAVGSIRVDG